ncbi:MAG TPA: prenyltransferase/squalene oxidase repeat-containing protein [Pirellulales bacterium]|nr:prenyltransferase/squalene oxidase repeat-containing protein [Pirellulales bacterium]
MVDSERLLAAYRAARLDLLARRVPAGHWEGELSSSALSTATAVSALALVRRYSRGATPQADEDEERISQLILRGIDWLADAQNADGGWGDTDKSLSNIATTLLVRAAFQLTCVPAAHADLIERADACIAAQGGIAGLRRRYGKDKTFAVPILTNCALAGLVSWHEVSPLPFELACFPQAWFRFLRLPVVSYAIPALVAIGQARYFHRKPRNPLARAIRSLSVDKSLRVLEQMQPASGGFLEATPLTSFVVMSLASIGQDRHPVVRRGIQFLMASARPDGSWPIDTNLATWVTTLSINALAAEKRVPGSKVPGSRLSEPAEEATELGEIGERCIEWLLDCQVRQVHPYTGAAPGGWGWSDLSGSVPDADDTPGALLALAALRPTIHDGRVVERIEAAASLGVGWLLDLQNSDGGWPTFCRGWAKLPFDRSGADLTAHALRALKAWQASPRFAAAVGRGFAYLEREQRADGSWIPLWFGNQHHPKEENPVYGTARVLLAYGDFGRLASPPAQAALSWLAARQNADGGWGGSLTWKNGRAGGKSSVEETALAVEALLAAADARELQGPIERGLAWLVEAVEGGRHGETSPLGFYFAKLWYYESLYPLIFTVAAVGRAVASRAGRSVPLEIAAAWKAVPTANACRATDSCPTTLR